MFKSSIINGTIDGEIIYKDGSIYTFKYMNKSGQNAFQSLTVFRESKALEDVSSDEIDITNLGDINLDEFIDDTTIQENTSIDQQQQTQTQQAVLLIPNILKQEVNQNGNAINIETESNNDGETSVRQLTFRDAALTRNIYEDLNEDIEDQNLQNNFNQIYNDYDPYDEDQYYDDEEHYSDPEIQDNEDNEESYLKKVAVGSQNNSLINLLSIYDLKKRMEEEEGLVDTHNHEEYNIENKTLVYDYLKSTNVAYNEDGEKRSKKVGTINVFGNPEYRKEIEEIFNKSMSQQIEEKVFKFVQPPKRYSHYAVIKKCEYDVLGTHIVELVTQAGDVLEKKVTNENFTVTLKIDSYASLKSKPVFKDIEYRVIGADLGVKKIKEAFDDWRVNLVQIPPVEVFDKTMNMGYVHQSNYMVLDTTEKLIWFHNFITTSFDKNYILGYDAETTGLKFYKFMNPKKRDVIVTHSISWAPGCVAIIPMRMRNTANAPLKAITKYIKPILEEYPIVAHNGAADVLFNLNEDPDLNIDLNLREDTMILIKFILGYLCQAEEGKNESRSTVQKNLEYLVKRMFGKDMINLKKQVFGPQKANFDFSILPRDYLIWYGCPDADLCRQLFFALRPKLEDYQEDMYLKNVLATKYSATESTYPGFAIDVEVFKRDRLMSLKDLNNLKNIFYTLVGESPSTLNIGSPKQLQNLLFNKLGVVIDEEIIKTKDGYSTNKATLEKIITRTLQKPSETFKEDILKSDGKPFAINKKRKTTKDFLNTLKHPAVALILAIRTIEKEITFYDTLLAKTVDGIYHPYFRVGASATYRVLESSAQTIKSNLKVGVIPYNKDYCFMSQDVRSQELVIAVNGSDDDDYINEMKNPEVDAHRLAASYIHNVQQYQITMDQRKRVKSFNFGILYKMSLKTLIQQAENTMIIKDEVYAAYNEIYQIFLTKFSAMLRAIDTEIATALKTGVIVNKKGLRMIYDIVIDIDDLENQVFDPTLAKPPVIRLDQERYIQYGHKLFTKMGNFPIQSAAAAEFYRALLLFRGKLKEHNLLGKVFIPLWVHDEMDLIIHKSVDTRLVLKLLKESWENKFTELQKNVCPQYVGIGVGTSWSGAKDDKAEMPVRLQDIIVAEYERGEPLILPGTDDEPYSDRITKYYDIRIREYMISRLFDLVIPQLEGNIYKTGKMIDAIVTEVFVLTKCDELFKILKDKEDITSLDHELIVKLLASDKRASSYNLDKLEFVETESKALTSTIPEDFKEYSLKTHPVFHKNLLITQSKIVVDIPKDTSQNVLQNLVNYFDMYKTNKVSGLPVLFSINGDEYPIKSEEGDIRVTGLSFNARQHLDRIFNGEELSNLLKPNTKEKRRYVLSDIIQMVDGKLVLDLTLVDEEDKNKIMNVVLETINNILDDSVLPTPYNKTKMIKKTLNMDLVIKNENASKLYKNAVISTFDFTLQNELKRKLGA